MGSNVVLDSTDFYCKEKKKLVLQNILNNIELEISHFQELGIFLYKCKIRHEGNSCIMHTTNTVNHSEYIYRDFAEKNRGSINIVFPSSKMHHHIASSKSHMLIS